ncbi:MAG TPA: hypothetical protein VM869_00880 [Enhygromyxa sp.]|nr:hypothetical protein [Enhygromyxa sp.]
MDSPRFKFGFPATLIVTTFLSATACKEDDPSSEGDDSSESTSQYCADIEDMATCDSEPGCGWDAQSDDCINTCFMIADEVECRSIERCEWNPLGGSETGDGGAGACEEPFT